MSYQNIHLSCQGGVATLSITSKMGSMNSAFWAEFVDALSKLDDCKVLILRGDKVFSAGLDLAGNSAEIIPALGNEAAFKTVVAKMHAAIEGIANLPIPVIAAVHGWCIGAGLELIAAADIRICSAETKFSLPEVRLGIAADLGGLQRLPRIIGLGRASYLALSAEAVNAQKAEQWGLVTEVLSTPEELFGRATELAQHLLKLPPKALEGTKLCLQSQQNHAESMESAVIWNAKHLSLTSLSAAMQGSKEKS